MTSPRRIAHGPRPFTESSSTKIQLGEFLLDTSLRTLNFRGSEIELAPRSFSVLFFLLQNSDRIVSKEELLRSLWPPGSVEQSMRQEIYTLRRALKDNKIPNCIKTISQFGYRFDHRAKVEEPSNFSSEYPRLSEADQRALAIASHFAAKGDSVSLARSLRWFEKVCAAAPGYVEAHIGALKALMTAARRSELPIDMALVRSSAHMREILAKDPVSQRTMILNAAMTVLLERKGSEGIASLLDLKAAMDESAHIHHVLAICYLVEGDLTKAFVEQATAVELDPTSLHLHADYGMLQIFAGDYATAKTQFSFLQKLEPHNPDICEWLAEVLTLQGAYSEAIETLHSFAREPAASASLCVAHARDGQLTKARALLNALLVERDRKYVSPYFLAKCYAALGEQENAIQHLCAVIREPIVGTIEFNPWFEALRSDRSFLHLLSQRSAEHNLG